MLKGKKTYIVCMVAVVYAVAAMALGEMSMSDAANYVLAAAGLAGVRDAVS